MDKQQQRQFINELEERLEFAGWIGGEGGDGGDAGQNGDGGNAGDGGDGGITVEVNKGGDE